MSNPESSFKKGFAKYQTANKTDITFSPSRVHAETVIKPLGLADDKKYTTHKRSLNFCKN